MKAMSVKSIDGASWNITVLSMRGALIVVMAALMVIACSSEEPQLLFGGDCVANGANVQAVETNGSTHEGGQISADDINVVFTELETKSKQNFEENSKRNYQLAETDSHNHIFTIDWDGFQALRNNHGFGVLSTEVNKHKHEVFTNCN